MEEVGGGGDLEEPCSVQMDDGNFLHELKSNNWQFGELRKEKRM